MRQFCTKSCGLLFFFPLYFSKLICFNVTIRFLFGFSSLICVLSPHCVVTYHPLYQKQFQSYNSTIFFLLQEFCHQKNSSTKQKVGNCLFYHLNPAAYKILFILFQHLIHKTNSVLAYLEVLSII